MKIKILWKNEDLWRFLLKDTGKEHISTFLIICEHACQPRGPMFGLDEIFKYFADS